MQLKTFNRAAKENLIANNRSSHWKYSIKKLFLKISEYSQENICGGVSFQQSCRP